MSYDTWKTTDALDLALDVIDAEHRYAEDDARVQRWDAFVALIKARQQAVLRWSYVIRDATDALWISEERARGRSSWCPSRFEKACLEFAEVESWPAVLQALSRAMREQETQS